MSGSFIASENGSMVSGTWNAINIVYAPFQLMWQNSWKDIFCHIDWGN